MNASSAYAQIHLSTQAAHTHPWPTGYIFESPGAHLTYRVIGPCCRLYDRHQLPWPCCRIQWRSKEPSWRRIGKRFIADLATRKHPSYCVEIIGQSYRSEPVVMTLYSVKFSPDMQNWWHSKRIEALGLLEGDAPVAIVQGEKKFPLWKANAQLEAELKTESLGRLSSAVLS